MKVTNTLKNKNVDLLKDYGDKVELNLSAKTAKGTVLYTS